MGSSGPDSAAAGGGSELSFLYDLTTAPCFRESSMLALGGGMALGALRLYKTRDAMRAGESMVKSGCGVALLSWVACRKRYYDEREATYGMLQGVRRGGKAADGGGR
eukprot:GFKZ01002070.1.p2 GENE.GFKZ01002070.1~~GFKZ01002070.1.p2  ORF type:complete len:107 (-),score=4.72 GFKZ01002070.1:404-724(-)